VMWNPRDRTEFWHSPGFRHIVNGVSGLDFPPVVRDVYFTFAVGLQPGDSVSLRCFQVDGVDLLSPDRWRQPPPPPPLPPFQCDPADATAHECGEKVCVGALDNNGKLSAVDHLSFGWALCPITYEPFSDPVVCADGHTYERAAIEHWLVQRQTSPMTGQVLRHSGMIPNVLMRSLVQELRGTRLLEALCGDNDAAICCV